MNEHAAEMRRCLEALDVPAMRRLWAHIAPHLSDYSDDMALVSMHIARTEMRSLPFRVRAYSHRWLISSGYPSKLPDHLKPKAERNYPVIADAVGIFNVRTGPITQHTRAAMIYAVEECYADGHRDAAIVRPRMMEARAKVQRQLLGIKGTVR